MRALVLGMIAWCAAAAVVDRVAVVVGKTVITETELLEEVRLTEFLNQEPLDLGPAARRAAAERLVDQELIRNEMKIGGYAQPSESEVENTLQSFRQEHFSSDAEYRAALAKYGISEEQLKAHLHWQLAALRFTDVRFGGGMPPAPAAAATADRSAPGAEPATVAKTAAPVSGANRVAAPESGASSAETGTTNVDQQMDAWLKEARSATRIQFKKGAFE